MGIKQLYAHITSTWPDIFVPTSFYDLRNYTECRDGRRGGKVRVAIDLMTLLFAFKIQHGETWQTELISMIKRLIHNDLVPIMVLDGAYPTSKIREQEARKTQRALLGEKCKQVRQEMQQGVLGPASMDLLNPHLKPRSPSVAVMKLLIENKIVPECTNPCLKYDDYKYMLEGFVKKLERQSEGLVALDIEGLVERCRAEGFVVIRAPGEAEVLCAWMVHNGCAEYAYSQDSDLVALLCPHILFKSKRNFGNGAGISTLVHLDLDKLLAASQFTRDQLVDWCILSGTDFNAKLPRIGINTAYDIVKKYGSAQAYLDSHACRSKFPVELIEAISVSAVRQLFDVNHCCIDKMEILCGDLSSIMDTDHMQSSFDSSCITNSTPHGPTLSRIDASDEILLRTEEQKSKNEDPLGGIEES